MAGSGTPSSFSASNVRAGLRRAMDFGLPTTAADQPTFFMPRTSTSAVPADDDGVPFDPAQTPTVSAEVKKKVSCAVEYVDSDGKIETFGIIAPSKIKLTFLDEDYVKVAGFHFVVIKGQKYFYMRTEPPVALGTVDIYTVHCRAEDEG